MFAWESSPAGSARPLPRPRLRCPAVRRLRAAVPRETRPPAALGAQPRRASSQPLAEPLRPSLGSRAPRTTSCPSGSSARRGRETQDRTEPSGPDAAGAEGSIPPSGPVRSPASRTIRHRSPRRSATRCQARRGTREARSAPCPAERRGHQRPLPGRSGPNLSTVPPPHHAPRSATARESSRNHRTASSGSTSASMCSRRTQRRSSATGGETRDQAGPSAAVPPASSTRSALRRMSVIRCCARIRAARAPTGGSGARPTAATSASSPAPGSGQRASVRTGSMRRRRAPRAPAHAMPEPRSKAIDMLQSRGTANAPPQRWVTAAPAAAGNQWRSVRSSSVCTAWRRSSAVRISSPGAVPRAATAEGDPAVESPLRIREQVALVGERLALLPADLLPGGVVQGFGREHV